MVARRKQLLILWDGAGWTDLHPLIDDGTMPNLSRLTESGAMGKLQSIHPIGHETGCVSLATGLPPCDHGIHHSLRADSAAGPAKEVTRSHWTPVWDQLTAKGDYCLEIGWPLTHPAADHLETSVSDRFSWPAKRPQYRFCLPSDSLSAPTELEKSLRQARMTCSEIGLNVLSDYLQKPEDRFPEKARLEILRQALAKDLTMHTAALETLEKTKWDFAVIHYPGLVHLFNDSHQHGGNFPEKNEHYQFLDLLLGILLDQIDDDTIVHLVSSHSYQEQVNGQLTPTDHGLWVMSGPGVLEDQLIHGGHVLDLAPTILALRGETPAPEMPHAPRRDLLTKTPPLHPRTGAHSASESSTYQAPWAHLLRDGRTRQIMGAEQLANPVVASALWQRAHLGEFQSLQQMKEIDRACEKGAELHRLFPNDLHIGLNYGHCLIEKNRWEPLSKLLADLRKLPRSESETIDLELMECALFQHQDDLEKLLVQLPSADANTPHTPFQWIKVAAFYRRSRRFDDALLIYQRLAATHERWLLPWQMMATVHVHQKDYATAAKIAQHLIAIDATQEKAHFLLATSLYRQGKKEEARQALDRFQELTGGTRNSQRMNRAIGNSAS